MSQAALAVLEAPRAAELAAEPDAFLRQLGRPTRIRVPGRDRSRVRVVATLLHGNEPSGLRAVHGWLRCDPVPAVDVELLVVSVSAALRPPGYAFRMLPGTHDLNRCFLGPFEGDEGRLARSILDAIQAAKPEALIDLHNNTGHNPPYGVGPGRSGAELGLASLFGTRFVENDIRLGALVEATQDWCPSVTVEAGRAGDPEADRTALEGLVSYVGAEQLPERATVPMQVFASPQRVTVRPDILLAFGDRPDPGADLTVGHDIERHNFEIVEPGEPIGWLRPGAPWPLVMNGAGGEDRSREWFEVRDGRLQTRTRAVPIMVTTQASAAREDCLFYLVRSVPS